MKHCVFCAANIAKNKESISIALSALENIKLMWDLYAYVHGVYEGSQFTVNPNDGNNTSIWAEDNDIHRLIYSCMAFAYERERLKYRKEELDSYSESTGDYDLDYRTVFGLNDD